MKKIAELIFNMYTEKRTLKDVNISTTFDESLDKFIKTLNHNQFDMYLNLETLMYDIVKDEMENLIIYFLKYLTINEFE